MRTDLTVYAKDYPEARLLVEVKPAISVPPEEDPAVQQVARSMWGANCHFGLIVTPTKTYVLRDDFTSPGPESIHVTDVLPTGLLLGPMSLMGTEPVSCQELETLARQWLERLVTSYETALADDPNVARAFFPDIVGAVAEGRVVAEAIAR
jgi:hypothetical protein